MTLTSDVLTHRWDAQNYHQNSSAQQEAALSLLTTLNLQGNENVLDIGCGDGKITAQLANRISQGNILGIDISSEMIDFAKSHFHHVPNLTFQVQDAQKLNYRNQFNVIFSSFALQWAEDINAFFRGAQIGLKPSGILVATIPLGISEALEQSITKIISISNWAPYFKGFSPGWHFKTANQYKQLLTNHEFKIIKFDLVLQEKIFPSQKLLEQYIKQWLSYLTPIPDNLKSQFFRELMTEYFARESLNETVQAYLRFERVDFIAQKNFI